MTERQTCIMGIDVRSDTFCILHSVAMKAMPIKPR